MFCDGTQEISLPLRIDKEAFCFVLSVEWFSSIESKSSSASVQSELVLFGLN